MTLVPRSNNCPITAKSSHGLGLAGVSMQNFFTQHLSDQLKRSNGTMEIIDLFRNTVEAMQVTVYDLAPLIHHMSIWLPLFSSDITKALKC